MHGFANPARFLRIARWLTPNQRWINKTGLTPDEVATVAALLMGPDGGFITGSDVLMDGGVTASYFFGELAPQ